MSDFKNRSFGQEILISPCDKERMTGEADNQTYATTTMADRSWHI